MSLRQGWINPYLFTVVAGTPYVSSGLVGYWDFANVSSYSGSGSTVNDLSSSGVNITTITGGTYVGTGAKCETMSGTSAAMSTTGSINLATGAYTMECLFYTTSIATQTELITINSGASYLFGFNGSSGTLYIYPGSGGPAITPGVWQHVVWSQTGTTGYVYLNGTKSTLSSLGASAPNVNLPIYFASRFGGTSAANLSGKFAYARIYNRLLTDAEVAQNYGVAVASLSGAYGLPSVSTPLEYPPSAMSTTTTTTSVSQTLTLGVSTFSTIATSTGTITYGGGSYTIMCSSCQATTSEDICNLFNKTNGDRWTPGLRIAIIA